MSLSATWLPVLLIQFQWGRNLAWKFPLYFQCLLSMPQMIGRSALFSLPWFAPSAKIMQCTMSVKLHLGSLSSVVCVHRFRILIFFKSSVRLRIYIVLFDFLVMGKWLAWATKSRVAFKQGNKKWSVINYNIRSFNLSMYLFFFQFTMHQPPKYLDVNIHQCGCLLCDFWFSS